MANVDSPRPSPKRRLPLVDDAAPGVGSRAPERDADGAVRAGSFDDDAFIPGAGSLGRDGKRLRPYPADVRGRFVRARRVVYYGLIVLWAALPWIPIGGHPAVFLDVERRVFYLFGATFNAQDLWLAFFLLSGFGFGLLCVTALLGRAWCGWACPQTVFTEAVFRPIERLVNGPRNEALRRASATASADAVVRRVVTHALYAVAAFLVAHVFLAYFVSLPGLFAMMSTRPRAHPEAFAWMLGTTALVYVAFAVFREQFCVVMCPYGRLQSVLLDDDALVVGYDVRRGEPRGKAGAADTGDCVDCKRCVVVCPTGIDIREGLQLDCIACTACIDACDEVMDRLDRPRGLVRYDSLRGLRGEKRRVLRPRLVAYATLLVVGFVVAAVAARGREPFEANLLRLPGAPYTRDAGVLRNGFEVHLVNKESAPMTFVLEPGDGNQADLVIPIATVEVAATTSRRIPIFATVPEDHFAGPRPVVVRIRTDRSQREVRATFLGARAAEVR
ncbi:MAG: cytochrome c oxidase accessory protein CcoG [Labilithrix sp.]|nr:cytochrome c oxidase accessory protein CcoG [Labilithrix sp.]MCW5812517.1 cytochrome c oxidase accessory protein CcoG [Labilithrix sp.]